MPALITPERIAKMPVFEVIDTLKRGKAGPPPKKGERHPQHVKDDRIAATGCLYTYQPFQQDVVLLRGIADIEPYHLRLPDPPPIEEFVNYGLAPKDQVFQRVQMPDELRQICKNVKVGIWPGEDKLTMVEVRQRATLAIESNPVLCAFVEDLWLKRLSGDWQLINGVPTHISPTYWFYLNFWEMNIGLPDFRTDYYHYCTDHWFFMFWDYRVVPSPYCDGAIDFAMRQTGKSYRLGVLMYEQPSRTYEANAGMQSKTDSDAALLFEKAVVKPWRKLPFFFQPIYSNSTYPKKGLEFTPPANRGKKGAIESLDNDELMGWIDFAASSLDGYDGPSLDRYGDDECGKTIEVDVYERYRTVAPTMRTKGGKSYHTTTVEELTKRGGYWFKLMWIDSDRSPVPRGPSGAVKVDEYGNTVSGLWPWFMPAYCTYSYDYFGVAIVDKISREQQEYVKSIAARKHIKYPELCGIEAINKIIDKETDQLQRQDKIRKHPRTIAEAFDSAVTHCRFKLAIINKRLQELEYGHPKLQYGCYEWKNNQFGGDVEFIETAFEDARIYRIQLPGEENYANKKIPAPGGKFKPGNAHLFFGSADTFKYNTTDIKNRSKMSEGAAHTFVAYIPQIDDGKPEDEKLTDDFIDEYLFRPDTVDEYCEDVLKMAIYRGMKVYPENNLDNVALYFKKHGFDHYLQFGRQVTFNHELGVIYKDELRSGSTTQTKTIETMFRVGAQYVISSGARCKFYRTLRQFKEVDDDLNPYDLFVSATVNLISAFDINLNPTKKQLEDNIEHGFNAGALRKFITGRNW